MKLMVIRLIAIVAIVTSCSSNRPIVQQVPIETRERIVERIVAVPSPSDSAKVQALFECDSLNNVIMRELKEEKGKRMSTAVSFNQGRLKYSVLKVTDTVYVTARDSFIYKEVPVEVKIPVEVNRLTAWQKLMIKAGKLFAIVLFVSVGWFVLKGKTKPVVLIVKRLWQWIRLRF